MEMKQMLKISMLSHAIYRRRQVRTILMTFSQIMQLIAGLPAHHKRSASLILCGTIYERLVWKFDRSSTFWESDVLAMDDKKFRDNFRLNRQSFHKLCDKVKVIGKKDTHFRPCIPLEKRVAIAMYALGSSAEYRTISHLFGVGVSTVGEIVLDFCHAIRDGLGDYINSYPPTDEEISRIVEGFNNLGFPQCFGAIDGCHIAIQPPKDDAVDFYNYKGWYSTILLAACDHRSKFTYINIGSAGKNNDSYIFENSSMKRFHYKAEVFENKCKSIGNKNVPVLLIGDSAFRLSRFLMKPFSFHPNQPQVEKNFNYQLSKCRRVIENAFGQLKARFRKIGKGLEVSLSNCNVIIYACCLLHNYLKIEEDDVDENWMEEYAAENTLTQPRHTTVIGDTNEDAKAIRNAIANSFDVPGTESGSGDGTGDRIDDDIDDDDNGEMSGIGTNMGEDSEEAELGVGMS